MTALSYTHGVSMTPLLGETIGANLRRMARLHPDQEAVVSVHQGRRFTYAEFNAIVDRAARAFLHLGIAAGDRVAIWSVNNYEWVAAQFATARIGAVLVNINPAYRTHELEYALRKSRAKALLLIEAYKSSNYLDMFYEVCPEARHCRAGEIESWRFPDLRDVIFIGREEHSGMFTRREFAALGDDVPEVDLAERGRALDIDDVINIQYTSGTTGFPKGVLLSHNNILNNAFFVGEIMRLSPADRMCVPVPFYHCFGMVVSNLAAVTHGATIVIPSPTFDASAVLSTVQEERCTVLHGVPTMFIAELDHPEFDSFDLSSLRTGVMAGAPCPIEVMRQVFDRMHMREILIGYGQTESAPVTTLTRPDTPIETRVSTVGTVMPHQELKIIDPESGRTRRRGVQGEICFRGYMVMAGYDDNPDATTAAIDAHGWLHSGDLGVMEPDGHVRVTGRIKDMVIRGGENIYPREIEEFLHTLPVVEDAYVVGVPDARYGEALAACIVLHPRHRGMPPAAEELAAMCTGRIAHFKIPRYWWIVEALPMTVTGKVQKFKLREQAMTHFGLAGGQDAAVEQN